MPRPGITSISLVSADESGTLKTQKISMNMPIMRLPLLVVLMAGLTGGARAEQAPPSAVKVEVDYPAFLVRQDLVFEKLPDQFDTGAFLGNGMLGATIYQTGPNTLRWEMGRADVTEHRRDNARFRAGKQDAAGIEQHPRRQCRRQRKHPGGTPSFP